MDTRPYFAYFLLWILVTAEWTSGQFLSQGVSQAVCKAHNTFRDTGKLVKPLKEQQNDKLPEKCVWFKKQDSCSSSSASVPDSSCLRFSKKTCQEIGISLPKNQKPGTAPLIIGGREVQPPHKYPSFATTIQDTIIPPEEREGGRRAFLCGVVIIKEKWALTAGHCVSAWGLGATNLTLMAGRHNNSVPEETEQEVIVVDVIFHPNITEGELEVPVDLALLRLDPPLKFNENISAAKLPTKRYLEGEFTIVGRGFLSLENETQPLVPHEVEQPIITKERCQEIADEENEPPGVPADHQFCLYKEGGGVGGCIYDSGGPAYKIEGDEQIVAGITYGGINGKCGVVNGIGFYIEVFKFLDWIEENMAKPPSK